MDASLGESPNAPAASDRAIDASEEQPVSNADPDRRDMVLLVEDNSLNMRVSLLQYNWRPTSIAASAARHLVHVHIRQYSLTHSRREARAQHPKPNTQRPQGLPSVC